MTSNTSALMWKLLMLPLIDLTLFDGAPNTQTTEASDLSAEMHTYYSDYLIDLAEPALIHDQFGQKHPIPSNGGKTIQFRQYDPLPEMTTPLVEGVTPDGQSMKVRTLESTVHQYGGYITLSDQLILTAVDNNVNQATKLLGSQGGRTMDTITRDVINAGTNVQYAGGVTSRKALHYTSANSNCNLTVDDIKRAVRYMESQDAPRIDGYYVGIINPYCKYDLMNDPEWIAPHQYKDTTNLYRNEIGELRGVRFVESSRAKVFGAEDLVEADGSTTGFKSLTVSSYASKVITISQTLTTAQKNSMVGKLIMIGSAVYTVTAATTSSLTIKETPTTNPASGNIIYNGEGGAGGVPVYSTLIIAADAYGVTDISGGGMQHFVKQLGSAGTADPLNQRATCGWKAMKTAEILIPQYLLRIESTATP